MKLLITLAAIAMLAASSLAADGPIRHVVHFRFKPGADQAQVQKVVEEFAALRTKIPLIESLEYGTNISPEGLDQGFTHCWIVSFKNAADRDAYLVHPDHKAFASGLKPVLDAALVVDFVTKVVPAK
ncbi:MAG: Dabb family protein [Chthoniobacteraceae bacterium]|nr:Dabb family protein [Chthoniobacteraceae bacterium]